MGRRMIGGGEVVDMEVFGNGGGGGGGGHQWLYTAKNRQQV